MALLAALPGAGQMSTTDPQNILQVPPPGGEAPAQPAAAQPSPAKPAENKPDVTVSKTESAMPATPMPLGAGGKPYEIGRLDVLEVRVWNDPKLTAVYDVRPDGMLSMPLIGEFPVDGLTVPQLTAIVKEKLTAFIGDPEVNIQVVRFNSKHFTIIGGCAKQGETPLIGDVTVLDALANCGGFREFANTKKIKVYRGKQEFKFNYKEVLQNKHMEQNILLQPGDRIVIPE
jgi:polysaccharide export outer membrane protein